MSDPSAAFVQAIADGDVNIIRKHFDDLEFVLIKVGDANDDDDDQLGALTANVDEFDVLVVFTTEQAATGFVQSMGELFEEGEEIEGFLVDGAAIMDYLPAEFGLLINPENEHTAVMKPELLVQLRTSESFEMPRKFGAWARKYK